ncbi:MAG TPA: Pls/PosA family non-ribosomal peptide synthetase, partial [Kineosporiaceae bacterium]
PLPTYSVVVLERDVVRPVPRGAVGEICVAGVGLARGYLNRPDLTARAFVDDVLGIPGNPSGRIYRTGDLGRVDDHGEIEYLGRIDAQIKIRGYRIELAEIESALLQLPGIATAVVQPYEAPSGVTELAAYYCRRSDAPAVPPTVVGDHLRRRLPPYMVPAYIEELDTLPMLPSDKVDRRRLPTPRRESRLGGGGSHVEPRSPTEAALARTLADVLGLERVSAQAHFFDDLGANSLVMARFCARVREHPDLARPAGAVSMKDVYLNPDVHQLAAMLDAAASPADEAQEETASVGRPLPRRQGTPLQSEPSAGGRRPGAWRYSMCGIVQAVLMLGYTYLLSFAGVAGLRWVGASPGPSQAYLRTLLLGALVFAGLLAIPVTAKWLLIGRWTPRDIPVWSVVYLRFWIVHTLIRFSVAPLLAGSPLYVLYLRALGARIGPGVLILSRNVPLCTDLLTIGAGSVIRKDSFFNGYRAQAGVIRTGRITLGTGAFVGEATVLDIDTQVGSGAQLGHSSALLPGQRIPDGERWHGCPAQRTTVDYQRCEPTTLSRSRPVLYGLGQLLNRLAVSGPAMFGISMLLVYLLPGLGDTLYGDAPPDIGDLQFYLPQLAAIAALLLGGTLVGLAAVTTLPRLLHRALTPGRVYPLYGSRYAVQRTIARVTNVRFFTTLFGDSSYITGYLSALGYRLTPVQQTGSNFGIAVKHEAPYLTTVGTGTIVSDGLSLMNAEFSATSFRMVGVGVSADSFIGNNIVFPSGARVGAGCLVATKTLLPLDGPVRENVGLLGSPPFEIPRSVHRDTVSDHPTTPEQLRPRLAAKNRHNLATMAAFLASRWLYLIMIILLVEIGTGTRLGHGTGTIALAVALIPAASAAYFIVIERAALGFRPLQPRTCSIYNRSFWRHERYWKLSTSIYLNLFNGTPMKSWIWRALGVRVGKMLYDDGCGIPEKSLITIGNHCTLNQASVMQGHSLEDGIFTSDRVVIGDNVTLSTGAFVHYGVAIGAGATLAADSFLMKGEQIPAHQHWHGNPARNILERSSQH